MASRAGRNRVHSHRRRGITASETVVVAVGVGVLLVVVALGMEGIRTDLKREQAVMLMATLDRALLAYGQSTGSWPMSDDPAAAGLPAGQVAAGGTRIEADPALVERMLQQMAGVAASRKVLDSLPEVLRVSPELAADSSGPLWGSVQDPWGRRLHCFTASSPLATHRKAVAANRNRPIFISAGPDGRFGFHDVTAASDNIRSDEIAR